MTIPLPTATLATVPTIDEVTTTPPADTGASMTLRSLFASNKRRMLLSYALFNVENLLRLMQPLALGLAINGLLKSSYVGVTILIAQHLAYLLLGTVRRLYDTRAFTTIYTNLATGMICDQRSRRIEVSRVVARSALSREYVEFFETYVPMAIRAVYSVVGALIMLAVYDWMLIPFCALLIVPAFLLNSAYGRKTLVLSRFLHDRFEHEVDVIARGDEKSVRAHYESVAGWRIKMSDAEAVNFSLMELFVLAAMVASLVHFCTSGTPQAGDIFAVFRYVLMFIMGMDTVPKLVGKFSRLCDIGRRLRVGNCS